MSDEARQASQGGSILAALEAELLHDDSYLRDQLVRLRASLEEWLLASDLAIVVRMRRLEKASGYTEDDEKQALEHYHNVRGQVLAAIHQIHEETTDD